MRAFRPSSNPPAVVLGSGTGVGPRCTSENQPWTLGNYQEGGCSPSAEGLSWEGITQQPSVFAKAKMKSKAKLNGQEGMLIALGECLDQAIPEAYNAGV